VEPIAGIDARQAEAFELLQCTVDGRPQPIRRAERKTAQLYSVHIGTADREVTLLYTYQVFVQRHGRLLYLDMPRPVKGRTDI
jgi:hypothetical protein